MNLVSIVGARPQFVKLATIARVCSGDDALSHKIIHTGQHYDDRMSKTFFDELEIPYPDVNLEIGSAGHGAQTGQMLCKIEHEIVNCEPDAVLIYGDTNSTLAGALAAAKLNLPTAHIESGLRSFDRTMPEEINRIVADQCSGRLYAPTPAAMQNLARENLDLRALWSGDVMMDAVLHNRQLAAGKSEIHSNLGLAPGKFGLVTVHRPVNTTKKELAQLLDSLKAVSKSIMPLIFPMHPRTHAVMNTIGFEPGPKLSIIDPVSYLEILNLLEAAAFVLTDSGGVQKEAAFLHTSCITVRDATEWVETVDLGVNRLVSNDRHEILASVEEVLSGGDLFGPAILAGLSDHFGDGKAAHTIVADLITWTEA